MELQIQDLVEKIQKDGVDAANEKASKILEEAEKKAAEIVLKAKNEAANIIKSGQEEIENIKNGAISSVDQAKRDAILTFKGCIEEEFEKILSYKISKETRGDELSSLIKAALAGEDVAQYSIEIDAISDTLKLGLREELENGLEIKLNPQVKQGFRVVSKDGNSYFDCSDDEIMSMLSPYFRDLKF